MSTSTQTQSTSISKVPSPRARVQVQVLKIFSWICFCTLLEYKYKYQVLHHCWLDLDTALRLQPMSKAAYRSNFRETQKLVCSLDSMLAPLALKTSCLLKRKLADFDAMMRIFWSGNFRASNWLYKACGLHAIHIVHGLYGGTNFCISHDE